MGLRKGGKGQIQFPFSAPAPAPAPAFLVEIWLNGSHPFDSTFDAGERRNQISYEFAIHLTPVKRQGQTCQ